MIKRKLEPFIAPIEVISLFKFYILWLLTVAMSLLGPIIDAINSPHDEINNFTYFINSGTLYYNIITLLFSFAVTMSLDMLYEVKHDNKKLPFLHYQLISFMMATFFAVLLTFFYVLFRSNAVLQIAISVFGYIFVFYLFCVSCMPKFSEELKSFSLGYDEQRKRHSAEAQEHDKETPDGMKL